MSKQYEGKEISPRARGRCSRREALVAGLEWGTTAAAVLWGWPVLGAAMGTSAGRKEASWSRRMPGGRAQCQVCPRQCVLGTGERSFCRNRRNRGGRIVNEAFDNPCVLTVDPVEKTPRMP